MLYGIIGLVVGILLTGITATVAVNSEHDGMMGMMGMQTGRSQADQHFIEQMIPHHDDAVKMADLALLRAEHPELKQLAENIKRDQTKEIEQMRSWYRDWYGRDPDESGSMMHGLVPRVSAHGHDSGMSGRMHGGMMGDSTDLTQLENAKPFDKEFIEQMIPHHQMAVMMAQMVKQSARHDEIRQLADNIIESQNREIEQMRSWYRAWGY